MGLKIMKYLFSIISTILWPVLFFVLCGAVLTKTCLTLQVCTYITIKTVGCLNIIKSMQRPADYYLIIIVFF